MAFTEDLSVFLADFGVVVVIGAATIRGIVDAEGVLELASISGVGEGQQFPGVQGVNRTVLIRTDQKGALVPGGALTVDGTARVAIVMKPIEDGALTLVGLR